jgi:hypothetical protein
MAASYPSSVRVFTTKANVTDTVDASHPNSLQEEVVAIENALGLNPSTSTSPNPSASFNASSTAFATVSARLANIETGVVADSHTQYLRKTADGASTNKIQTGTTTNRGLIVQGFLNQTANLQEWQDSIGVIQAAVQPDGTYTGKVLASQIQGSVTAIPADATITQKAASFTLDISLKNAVIYCVNTDLAGITITVPTDSVAFPVGSTISIIRGAAGPVTFAATSPASVNSTPGLKLRATWSGATLIKLANNTWWLSGDLSA